jgi:hypothetical protein
MSVAASQNAGVGMSRIIQMFNAKDSLPEGQRLLFDTLFVKGMTDEQAGRYLQMDAPSISLAKRSMIRQLKSAIA